MACTQRMGGMWENNFGLEKCIVVDTLIRFNWWRKTLKTLIIFGLLLSARCSDNGNHKRLAGAMTESKWVKLILCCVIRLKSHCVFLLSFPLKILKVQSNSLFYKGVVCWRYLDRYTPCVLVGCVPVLVFSACSFVPHASFNDVPTPTQCCRALQWLSTDIL